MPKESGPEIAKKLGIHFDGVQPGWDDIPAQMQFTDIAQTRTTFYAKDLNEARHKLLEKRKLFAAPMTEEQKLQEAEKSLRKVANLLYEDLENQWPDHLNWKVMDDMLRILWGRWYNRGKNK